MSTHLNSECVQFIVNAKPEKERFELVRMAGKVWDYHTLAETLQDWKKGGIKWKQVRELQVDPANPWEVQVKHDLSATTAPLRAKVVKARGRPFNLQSYVPDKCADGPLQLSAPKKKDLKEMVKGRLIPEEFHDYYKTLYGESTSALDAEELELNQVPELEEMLDFDGGDS